MAHRAGMLGRAHQLGATYVALLGGARKQCAALAV